MQRLDAVLAALELAHDAAGHRGRAAWWLQRSSSSSQEARRRFVEQDHDGALVGRALLRRCGSSISNSVLDTSLLAVALPQAWAMKRSAGRSALGERLLGGARAVGGGDEAQAVGGGLR